MTKPLIVKDCISGHFKIEAIRPDGTKRLLAPWQSNLVTNSGLDNFFRDGDGWIKSCLLGDGTDEPQITDTALQSLVARRDGRQSASNGAKTTAPFYSWETTVYRFPIGSAAGTLREIGLGNTAASGWGITTRSLIVDTNGDPTFIFVAADEQVDVTYEVRFHYPDVSQRIGTMEIEGIWYDTIYLPMDVDAQGGWNAWFYRTGGITVCLIYRGDGALPNIGTHLTTPVGNLMSQTAVRQAYVLGNYYRDSIVTQPYTQAWYLTKGLTAIGMQGYHTKWQMSFKQQGAEFGIPHNNTNELKLYLRQSLDRYTPP